MSCGEKTGDPGLRVRACGRGFGGGSSRAPARRGGFSLVELLVVIAIIALVISIILPALGSVRTQARIVATRTLEQTIVDAAGVFARDHDRQPGYYSVEEMGSPQNGAPGGAGNGMTAMENALLDLMGGVVIVGSGGVPSDPQTQCEFGPTTAARNANNAANRMFDTSRFGVQSETNPTYLTLDPKYLVAQGDEQQMGVAGHVAIPNSDSPSIPDIVDAFGYPLLAWVENQNALGQITEAQDFVAMDSGLQLDVVARYYWASNAGFLKARQLGSERRDQVPGTNDRDYSLISDYQASPLSSTIVRDVMVAMLGSPAYPVDAALTGVAMPGTVDFVPTQGRAPFFVQSAGPDGYYMGSRDRGTRRLGGNANVHYSYNFFVPTSTNVRHVGDNGQPTTIDLLPFYDDITAQGGA